MTQPLNQGDPLGPIRNSPFIAQLLASPTVTSTSTPSPTLTSTPSPTPNATATQEALDSTSTVVAIQASATQAGDWQTIFSETFDKPDGNWTVGHTEDDYARMDSVIENGVYRWDATAIKGFVETEFINTQSLRAFFISLDARKVSGAKQATYGLMLRRDTEGNQYYFAVSQDFQKYSFGRWMDGEWTLLADWTYTSVIRTDKLNRLSVLAQGGEFYLFINDQFVAHVSDSSIAKGITGFGFALGQADLQATFEFDNIIVRVPGN